MKNIKILIILIKLIYYNDEILRLNAIRNFDIQCNNFNNLWWRLCTAETRSDEKWWLVAFKTDIYAYERYINVTGCLKQYFFSFGATAHIWALAYLHETFRFTSVY
jgi:hypothetical protein